MLYQRLNDGNLRRYSGTGKAQAHRAESIRPTMHQQDPGNRRTSVVTGARSGIGKATAELLENSGQRVLGVDLSGCTINVDLTTATGRADAIEQVKSLCPEGLDALVQCAGLSNTDGPAVVSVNFFGAVALADGLRALLAMRDAPRAVIVSSSAASHPVDDAIVSACLEGNEARARSLARVDAPERQGVVYASSKRAISKWIRRAAPSPEWAGAGILLNGVAPGLVRTPMTIPLLETSEGRDILGRVVPRAVKQPAEPEDVALLLAFLASPDNRYLVGQVPYCDGGTDVITRGDTIF
jgi:NAD(P)-dependent dehydrogenase (short-subunit alcohol dehydrogenase family)